MADLSATAGARPLVGELLKKVHEGLAMRLRLFAGLAVVAGIFLVSHPAQAFFWLFTTGSPAQKTLVNYPENHRAGTIVIDTAQRRLYYMLGNGQAIAYAIGVGRDGFTWRGVHHVSAKREWPAWTPPPQMLQREPSLPRYMPGGIDNPLGARAIYLGSTLYRIHGSNEPGTIGAAVSSGCFRMTNDDVVDLYQRVQLGATVIVR
jgi:lipoprotein-anchoring transpeptidase ErfK/SrfK